MNPMKGKRLGRFLCRCVASKRSARQVHGPYLLRTGRIIVCARSERRVRPTGNVSREPSGLQADLINESPQALSSHGSVWLNRESRVISVVEQLPFPFVLVSDPNRWPAWSKKVRIVQQRPQPGKGARAHMSVSPRVVQVVKLSSSRTVKPWIKNKTHLRRPRSR